MKNSKGHQPQVESADVGRRDFLTKTALAGAALALSAVPTSASQQQATSSVSVPKLTGRRKLGSLEVSPVGLGVQNMSRKYETTVPYRPEMINIIRTAYDRGVTFFDTAEAYGPLECERILGEHRALPQQGRNYFQVRLEHRPRDRSVPTGAQQPHRSH